MTATISYQQLQQASRPERRRTRSSSRSDRTMTMTVFVVVLSILQIFNIASSSSSIVAVVAFSPAVHQAGRRINSIHNHPRQQHFGLSAVTVLDTEATITTATATSTTTVETNKNVIDDNDDDDKDRIYTVQILMSDTGGGHRASANAIRDALDVLHPGRFVCDIVDIYTDYGPFFPYNAYPQMYKIMAKHSWMWDVFYRFGETEFGLALNEFLLTTFCTPSFRECLQRMEDPATMISPKQRADMVVSVHPLCQDVPLKVLEELDGGKRTTPFVTVVTDLGGAHKTWFNPSVDKCFVPSDVLNEKAKSRGLHSSQIVQHGLPVRRGFWADTDQVEEAITQQSRNMPRFPFFATEKTGSTNEKTDMSLREKLGLQKDLPTCLVVGGGDGMGGIADIASALGQELGKKGSQPTSQMVVVCGNNRQAQEDLEKIEWGDGVNVLVQGFVSNMDEWMNASDCLVTKAGPGSIAEASICGLPCMLFAYLPGQEEGNVPFVEENGFGKYSSDPNVIAQTVSSWLESPHKIETMKAAAINSARPNSTLDIAKELAETVFATTA